ncbi:MAG: HAD family phosphatase [Lachnospira sp.]|nr:HAD family phosphatase [Lachnospira sp.]
MQITNNKNQHYELMGVIFDMDGLIYDSERMFFRHKREVMKEYGYTETEENYSKTLGLTGETLKQTVLSLYGEDYPYFEISQKARKVMMKTIKKEGLPIKSGIVPLLQFLNSHELPCAIASSTHIEYIKEYLSATGLSSYFQAVIGGDMITNSKPAPDIFLEAARQLNCEPKHCLVLEDSENGILAAHRAGIPVIGIPDMKYPAPEYIDMTFDLLESAENILTMLTDSSSD